MKKKTIFAMLILAALMIFILGSTVFAADSSKTVSAQLSPDFTIVVDGNEQDFYNADGEEVYPIVYNGTTYLPLRAIGELMDKNVDWDQTTKTITLSGSRNGDVTNGTPNDKAKTETVSASLRYDFTIVVDGVKQTFTDANGKTVYPLLYEGSTYLPVRAIGTLMGKTVDWDAKTSTVTLTTNTEGNLVTDADTFGQGGAQTTGNQTNDYIGEAKAKQIALDHAGLKENQVTFVHTKLDYDDGRWEYEVEFYADYTEYDYDINALTGDIISFDHDAEYYNNSSSTSQNNSDYIGEEKAKQIALDRAELSESEVVMKKCKLDSDDGRWEYEIEFYAGGYEYEFEIDALNGTILSYDKDRD